MDERRLSTGDILVSGLLNKPTPITDIPTDRETINGKGEDWGGYIGNDAVAAAIEAGKLVEASNYYGIPCAWKAESGVYRGCLLQYRSVTESPVFATAAQAAEWFGTTCEATEG